MLSLYQTLVNVMLSFSPALSSSNRSSESGEEEQQQTLEGRSDERELQVKVCLQGLEVGLCGGDLGEVMSTSVTGELTLFSIA